MMVSLLYLVWSGSPYLTELQQTSLAREVQSRRSHERI
jgi:hypothetical protein